jgi:hypothetical protein
MHLHEDGLTKLGMSSGWVGICVVVWADAGMLGALTHWAGEWLMSLACYSYRAESLACLDRKSYQTKLSRVELGRSWAQRANEFHVFH